MLEKLTRVPSSQRPFGLSVLHLGTQRHLSRSCGWLFVCTLSPFVFLPPSLSPPSLLPSLPPHTSLQELRRQCAGPWRLAGAEWETLGCLRRESQSHQLHSHCLRRDGDSRKVRFRTPAHRAVLLFWPSLCGCMPHTTMLGISRSSQE